MPLYARITLLILALALSACGGGISPVVRDSARNPPTPQREVIKENDGLPRQEIRLGLMLPLTGPDAPIGKALFNAATLALFDSGDQRLSLLPYDTRGTAAGAIEAMTKLLARDPDIIIGPLFSHTITAIKPLAQEAQITIIGFSSDHKVAGDGVFLINFPLKEQIERITRYASDQGYARYGALIPDTKYGSRAINIFGASLLSEKREFTAVEFYPSDSTKLVEPVKNIARYNDRRKNYRQEIDFLEKLGDEDDFALEMLDELKNAETIGEAEFDAILLPEGGAMLTTLTAWVSYYEIDPARVKILGTGLWDDEMLLLEPQLHGGWFAAPDHDKAHKFQQRYKEIYGQDGPRLITLAYDAVALAATLVRHAQIPDFSPEKLTDENGFSGIDGIFRFKEDGLIARGLAVYEVGAKSFTIIDPAPKSFIERDDTLDVMPESAITDYSKAASLAPKPVNDGRPFPYNPVVPDHLSEQDQ